MPELENQDQIIDTLIEALSDEGFDPDEVRPLFMTEADFRVIEVFPKLLAALERAVALYGKEGGPWNVPGEPGSWISEARAAITAAKGE